MLRQRPFSSSMDARKTAVSPRYFSLFRPPTNGTYVGACTGRHLRPIFRGGRWPVTQPAGGWPGRVHLAGLGMDEARSRPGRGWLFQQLRGGWEGLRPGRGTPALPRSPLPFFIFCHLVDLATRPGRSWRVQQLGSGWSGLCPGRGTPPPFLHPPSPGPSVITRPGRGWLVQQLSDEWFGLCPGRGTPPLPFFTPHSAPDPQKQ